MQWIPEPYYPGLDRKCCTSGHAKHTRSCKWKTIKRVLRSGLRLWIEAQEGSATYIWRCVSKKILIRGSLAVFAVSILTRPDHLQFATSKMSDYNCEVWHPKSFIIRLFDCKRTWTFPTGFLPINTAKDSDKNSRLLIGGYCCCDLHEVSIPNGLVNM